MIEAYGLKTHVWNNNLRSMLLLVFFPILLLFLAFAFTLLWTGFTSDLTPDEGLAYALGAMPRVAPVALGAAGGWFAIAFLGHQAMIEHYGGKVERASQVVHGKASLTYHQASGIFNNLVSPLPVARYHSLVATEIPECLAIIATTGSMPMAISHKTHKSIGFQFHPESILTTLGSQLLIQTLSELTGIERHQGINS